MMPPWSKCCIQNLGGGGSNLANLGEY